MNHQIPLSAKPIQLYNTYTGAQNGPILFGSEAASSPNASAHELWLQKEYGGRITYFSGSPWEDANTWLKRFLDLIKVKEWTKKPLKIKFAFRSLLTGVAAKWWDAKNLDEIGWENIQELFKETYIKSNINQLENSLINRRQEIGELVESYIYDIENLINQIDPAMKSRQQLMHLKRGLRPYYAEYLVKKNPNSFEKAVEILKEAARVERELTIHRTQQNTLDIQYLEEKPKKYGKHQVAKEMMESDTGIDKKMQVNNLEEKKIQEIVKQVFEEIKKTEEEVKPYKRKFIHIFDQEKSRNNGFNPNKEKFPNGRRQRITQYRTVEGIPICKNCLKAGHIERFCWSKSKQRKTEKVNEEPKQEIIKNNGNPQSNVQNP